MNMVEQQRKRALNRLPIYNIHFTYTQKPKERGIWSGGEGDIDRLRKWNCGKRDGANGFTLISFEHGKVHVIDLKFPENMNNRQK